jgi:hypothetical protein
VKVTPTTIPDLLILEPRVFGDDRGFFFESFNARRFAELTGVETAFVQDNHSRSARGVLRGLHYQILQPQGKLVRVVAGEVWDVAVDIRRGSPSFGQWQGAYLSADNKRQLWIPAGSPTASWCSPNPPSSYTRPPTTTPRNTSAASPGTTRNSPLTGAMTESPCSRKRTGREQPSGASNSSTEAACEVGAPPTLLHKRSPSPRIDSTDYLFGTRRFVRIGIGTRDRQSLGFIDSIWMTPKGTNPPRRRVHRRAFGARLSHLASHHRGRAANTTAPRWSSLGYPRQSSSPRWSCAWHGGRVGISSSTPFAAGWVRIFSMMSGSSMQAMIHAAPLQPGQLSLSILKARLGCQLGARLRSLIRYRRLPAQGRQRPWRGTLTGFGGSALGPFSHLQRVIHLDAKVSDGALKFAVTKQELYGPQVFRTPVDQCRLGSAQRMGAVLLRVAADQSDPALHDPCVLPD